MCLCLCLCLCCLHLRFDLCGAAEIVAFREEGVLESYQIAGKSPPYRYPLSWKEWNTPGTTAKPGMNRGKKLCVIQKTCFLLGAHDVRKAGFIFQSSCRCLQRILTPFICERGRRMRATVGQTDPGDTTNHVHINVPTP